MPLSSILPLPLFLAACAATSATLVDDDLDLFARLEPIPGHVERDGERIVIESPAILRDDDHHVWGASAIRGEDGRYHLFHVRIDAGPEARPFGDEWLFSSEIGHAVSDSPDRDFVFDRVVLRGRAAEGKPEAWDAQSVHNPHVRRFGERVYLYHIGSRYPGPQPAGSPGASLRQRDRIQQVQQTGVVVAESAEALAAAGFERGDQPLLGARTRVKAKDVIDPSPPGTAALPDNLIVVNPSVVRQPSDGRYLLYFKGNLYDPTWRGVHGVALGDAPAGPFRALDRFVFDVRMPDGRLASAEDSYVWHDDRRGRFYAIVKDFSGRLTGGEPGLALLTSLDGLAWERAKHPLVSPKELRFADGARLPVQNLERPQLLLDDAGRPRVLYAACIVGKGYEGHAFNVALPLQVEGE